MSRKKSAIVVAFGWITIWLHWWNSNSENGSHLKETQIVTPDYILPMYYSAQERFHEKCLYSVAMIFCSNGSSYKSFVIVIELSESLIRKTTSFLILSPLGYSFIHYSFEATPLGCIPFIPTFLHYHITLKFKRQPPLSSSSNQVSQRFRLCLLPTWELITNQCALY